MSAVCGWVWDVRRQTGIVTVQTDSGEVTAHRFTDAADCDHARLESKRRAGDALFANTLTADDLRG